MGLVVCLAKTDPNLALNAVCFHSDTRGCAVLLGTPSATTPAHLSLSWLRTGKYSSRTLSISELRTHEVS